MLSDMATLFLQSVDLIRQMRLSDRETFQLKDFVNSTLLSIYELIFCLIKLKQRENLNRDSTGP